MSYNFLSTNRAESLYWMGICKYLLRAKKGNKKFHVLESVLLYFSTFLCARFGDIILAFFLLCNVKSFLHYISISHFSIPKVDLHPIYSSLTLNTALSSPKITSFSLKTDVYGFILCSRKIYHLILKLKIFFFFFKH